MASLCCVVRPAGALSGEGAAVVNMVQGARYYSCATSTNAAGLSSSVTCSTGTVYDGTPPSDGAVSHTGGGAAFLNVTTTLCAQARHAPSQTARRNARAA